MRFPSSYVTGSIVSAAALVPIEMGHPIYDENVTKTALLKSNNAYNTITVIQSINRL